MLRELVIRDFAIVDRLELSLGPGLTCLTGETGAGKSILVDAIGALLGGKAGPESLRDGREAVIEAAFDISGLGGLKEKLNSTGFGEGDELILKRVVSASRGKAFINGSLASIPGLREAGGCLVDMHGQHEHQSLLRVDSHLGLLDAYCALPGRVAEYSEAYSSAARLRKEIEELRSRGRERAQRLDLLRFQRDEIDKAAPVPGEEGGLLSERARLMHADRLRSLAEAAIDALNTREASALALVGGAAKAVREIAALVPGQDDSSRLMETAEVSLREVCSGLRDLAGTLDADPERLSVIEERLDALARLRKKYGETVEDVLAYRENIEAELRSIENTDQEISGLEAGLSESEARVKGIGGQLTAARKKGGSAFSRKVEAELAGIGMAKARFEARLTPLDAPGPRGLEAVEFMISANPGEPPKPLSRVASGGELSRVMLALKVILARADNVPTLIFDEVDSGVGGATALALGKKLREAAAGRQVLCITHLPQVASLAEEHFTVEKYVEGGATRVRVRKLGKEERVAEITRMLGGDGLASASAHAAELVRQGELYG